MRHLPAFFDIAGKVCSVVGGGEVAARNVALLERAGGRVRVILPELVPYLSHGVAAGRAQHIGSGFSPDHLDGATVAIISNGKKGTRPFFDAVEERLVTQHGVASVVRLVKSNYSAPVESGLLSEAARWHALVAGVGD